MQKKKAEAVEREDYTKATALKVEIEKMQADLGAGGKAKAAEGDEARKAKIAAATAKSKEIESALAYLKEQKAQAIAAEDFDRAKECKSQIERKTAELQETIVVDEEHLFRFSDESTLEGSTASGSESRGAEEETVVPVFGEGVMRKVRLASAEDMADSKLVSETLKNRLPGRVAVLVEHVCPELDIWTGRASEGCSLSVCVGRPPRAWV